MSETLNWVKNTSAAGCIRDSKSIDWVLQNTLNLTLQEIGSATGRDLRNLEQYIIEDGGIYYDEDSLPLEFADMIEHTEKLEEDSRLYYAMQFVSILSNPGSLNWFRFFTAISVKSFVAYLRGRCSEYRKSEYIEEFFEAACDFNIDITDKTTIGDFIRAANNRVYKTWLPGACTIGNYEQRVRNGCRMIMDLFKGLGMLITKQREPQRQKNAEMTEMYLDWVFEGKPLPEHITAALKK